MKIIAHRGYSAKYPENTLAAFEAAMDVGADMLEFDVLLSKDKVPVIIHDDTLDRTTNGKGLVASLTLKELKKLKAGGEELIPTLEEVLQLTKSKIDLHIEIKTEAVAEEQKDGVEELTLGLVNKYNFNSACIISSFSLLPLSRIKQMDSTLALAHTFDHSLNDVDKNAIERLKPSAIHLPINKIRREEMLVNVYTVNSPVQMKMAQDLCVEGIFTNEVEKALVFFT